MVNILARDEISKYMIIIKSPVTTESKLFFFCIDVICIK